MTERVRVKAGDWVQIEQVVLQGGQRAPDLPTDTANLPLVMRLKGFALTKAAVGEPLTVRTIIGREVSGTLVDSQPAYEHDFGRPVTELLQIAPGARELLRSAGRGEL